jgi:hypothetical protein
MSGALQWLIGSIAVYAAAAVAIRRHLVRESDLPPDPNPGGSFTMRGGRWFKWQHLEIVVVGVIVGYLPLFLVDDSPKRVHLLIAGIVTGHWISMVARIVAKRAVRDAEVSSRGIRTETNSRLWQQMKEIGGGTSIACSPRLRALAGSCRENRI